MQIRKLLLYGILLTLIPFSAKAIQMSISELRNLFSGQEQEQDLGATVCYPYQGCTGKGTATAGDVGKYLKVSGNSPFTYSFDTPAGGSGTGGGSSIWSTTTPMTIYYNQEGYPLVIGNNATSSDGTIFEVVGNSYFDGTLKVGEYTFPSSDGTNGYTLKTNGSGTLTWSEDNNSINYLSQIGDVSTSTLANGYILNYQDGWTSTSNLFIDESGNVGIGTNAPEVAKLHIIKNSVTNKDVSQYAGLLVEDTEGLLQFIAADTGRYAGGLMLTSAPTTGDNKHWGLLSKGPDANNRFDIGYYTGASEPLIHITPHFTILTGGNIGIGTTSPTSKFSMNSGANGFRIDSSGIVQQGTWNGTALTDAYVSDDLTVNGYMEDTDIDTFAELQSWVSGYTDNDTTYTAGGTLLDLTGTTFSLNEGTMTDTKYCTYESGAGLVCNSEGGAGGTEWTDGGLFLYPTETSDVIVMGGNATTTTGYILETIGDILTDGLTVDDGSTSATTVLELGADTNIGCIKMRDSDRAGWSYLTILNGVLTASVNSCE